ncbi:hypothetical protein A1507_19835 [Methylomonas koyamae]|uniref:DUF2190 domain-containing protein n=1 Tax=Methylomonas koyamae TaxID=702114 RepID=A0A177N1R6_9GAMM|nr:capsid cement protein [Methylomonas koyamae]OAI11781.1 hypothetical protein A1507_19835 [Methylomonas koyamae]
MSRQCTPILTLPLTLTGTVVAERFVTVAGAQTGAAGNALGVTRTAGVSGEVVPVDVVGTAIVETGAAISAGALVEADASGRAVTKSAGVTLGRLAPGQSATAAGQFVEVILIQN